jgi:NhaA family Na+:H+ antiporter
VPPNISPRATLQRFLDSEAAGGLVLMASAAIAFAVANSPGAAPYSEFLHAALGPFSVERWINDGLMALFFLLVGLEIKREMVQGELNSWPKRALPVLAAFGGMVVPALIFVTLNWHSPETLRGWAIPTATDIAFALGVLSLLGSRVPSSLKVFLTSLAIIDDLGAILIIALFYSSGLSLEFLALAGLTIAALLALNRLGVRWLLPYLGLGGVLWVLTLFSGIHATLAGVALAFTIPLGAVRDNDISGSPVCRLEHGLSRWVAFLVLPLFGFANAGVTLASVSPAGMITPLPLGIMLGLFLGKQTGILGSIWLAAWARVAELPSRATWRDIYGVAILCGIGFTMSLFIALLAFHDSAQKAETKLAILGGSLLSALVGAAILLLPRSRGPGAADQTLKRFS